MKNIGIDRSRMVKAERAARSFKQAGRMLYFFSTEIMELLQEVHS